MATLDQMEDAYTKRIAELEAGIHEENRISIEANLKRDHEEALLRDRVKGLEAELVKAEARTLEFDAMADSFNADAKKAEAKVKELEARAEKAEHLASAYSHICGVAWNRWRNTHPDAPEGDGAEHLVEVMRDQEKKIAELEARAEKAEATIEELEQELIWFRNGRFSRTHG